MKKILLLITILALKFNTGFAQWENIDILKQRLANAKEDTAKHWILFKLAQTYLFSYPDTSAAYAKQGLEIAQKLNIKGKQVGPLNILCLSLSLMGNFPGALNFGFKALAISEELNDTGRQVYSNNSLMECYRRQQDYKQALEYGYQAKKLFTTPYADIEQASIVLGNIGKVYEEINQFDSALYYLQKSYSLTKHFSMIPFALGRINAKKNNHGLALTYYNEGITIAKKFALNTDLVDIYDAVSKVFEKTGYKDSAIYYASKSYTQQGGQFYPDGKLNAVIQLAHLYEFSGNKDSLIKYQKIAITLKDSLFSRQKTREAQNISFNEKTHQQELAAQQLENKNKLAARQLENKNKIKMYGLLGVIFIFLLIGFILYQNNRQKQKANTVLQKTLAELKSTQSQLIQSEKMASLGELTAGIAHEIQNPLNFVNNFSEVNKELLLEMQDEIDKGNLKEVKSIANDLIDNQEKINHHGKRADAIVKGMMQHSQVSTGQKESTDINALADEYLRLSYHGIRAKDKTFNANLKTDFDNSIGKINLVPQDIGRVLLNLYNNAFYAVNEKKRAADESYKPIVSVQTKRIYDEIEIRVSDNGNGIPQHIVDKIFQPFFTTKPTGQGTGLGLSLSYDIIKAHGGEIKVESKEGEGTEFIIKLTV